jgi:hypothetical protein
MASTRAALTDHDGQMSQAIASIDRSQIEGIAGIIPRSKVRISFAEENHIEVSGMRTYLAAISQFDRLPYSALKARACPERPLFQQRKFCILRVTIWINICHVSPKVLSLLHPSSAFGDDPSPVAFRAAASN